MMKQRRMILTIFIAVAMTMLAVIVVRLYIMRPEAVWQNFVTSVQSHNQAAAWQQLNTAQPLAIQEDMRSITQDWLRSKNITFNVQNIQSTIRDRAVVSWLAQRYVITTTVYYDDYVDTVELVWERTSIGQPWSLSQITSILEE